MDGVKAAARGGGAGHLASSVSSMLPGCSVLARGVPSSAPVRGSAPVSASARAPVLAATVAVRSSAALPFRSRSWCRGARQGSRPRRPPGAQQAPGGAQARIAEMQMELASERVRVRRC